MGFPGMAARLRELANRSSPTTEDTARRTINDLVAQAVRHYRELAYADRKGFDRGDVPAQLTGNDHKDAPALHRCWRERIVPKLQAGFPGRVPHDPFVSNPEPEFPWVDPATATSAPQVLGPQGQSPRQPWPLSAWRQRAGNYAELLDILAEVAGETATAATTAAPAQREELGWLPKALLTVRDHPDWPDCKIAACAGVHPSTVCRSNDYQQGARLARDTGINPPKGYIDVDPDTGAKTVEAVAPGARPGDDHSDRGKPKPKSRYFQEYCAECNEPIGVLRDQVGKRPLCGKCNALNTQFGTQE